MKSVSESRYHEDAEEGIRSVTWTRRWEAALVTHRAAKKVVGRQVRACYAAGTQWNDVQPSRAGERSA